MGAIIGGMITAVVLCTAFELWRRHHQDKATPVEALIVGLLVTVSGVVLVCLVVFVLPVIPAYAWTDIVLVLIKLATLIAGITLALGGARLAVISTRELRSPYK
jgi:formate hydrogenlyase subunit 3/multisubunit Na+/H+ antiporter MnhD subunit